METFCTSDAIGLCKSLEKKHGSFTKIKCTSSVINQKIADESKDRQKFLCY